MVPPIKKALRLLDPCEDVQVFNSPKTIRTASLDIERISRRLSKDDSPGVWQCRVNRMKGTFIDRVYTFPDYPVLADH